MLLDHVAALDQLPSEIERLWVIGEEAPNIPGPTLEPFPNATAPVERAEPQPGDTLAILYTSGTTGPSKGVCCPHAQFYWYARNTAAILGIGEGDVLYTCLPLFPWGSKTGSSA
jgi:crotonobetaine/carnitine-CoA ligase